MVEVTRELDPTRLVIDNNGWDHTEATELIQAQPHIDGYCYIPFNDTYQEQNGLVGMERKPILPPGAIKAINEAREK
jgi:hypothetical protein